MKNKQKTVDLGSTQTEVQPKIAMAEKKPMVAATEQKDPVWQDEYLSPNIESKPLTVKLIWKSIKDFFIFLLHAISPHAYPTPPKLALPDITSDDEHLAFDMCKSLYEASHSRIDNLEDKSMKLLPYITALFAFYSFAYLNIANIPTKVSLLTAMLFLLLSIIISFRCVSVKGRRAIFIPTIYDMDEKPPKELFKRNTISKGYLKSAIINQSVADNTADILRAARSTLTLALIIGLVGCMVGVIGLFGAEKTSQDVKILQQNETTILVKSVQDEAIAIRGLTERITSKYEIQQDSENGKLERKNQELSDALDTTTKKVDKLESELKNLLEKLNTEPVPATK